MLNRVAWIRNHISQPEIRRDSVKRINDIIDTILVERDKNILVVSYAGTLYEIQKILLKKGFKVEMFLKARNGKLYKFNNTY